MNWTSIKKNFSLAFLINPPNFTEIFKQKNKEYDSYLEDNDFAGKSLSVDRAYKETKSEMDAYFRASDRAFNKIIGYTMVCLLLFVLICSIIIILSK